MANEPVTVPTRRPATVALGEQGHGEPLDTVRTRARRKGAQWVLSGAKPAVVDGHTADWAVVVARSEEGVRSYLLEFESPGVAAGARAELVPSLDPTRKLARLVLDEAPVVPLGPPGNQAAVWRRVQDDVAVALAAETGRSYGFIHRMLTEMGVTLRSRGGAPKRTAVAK